MIRFAPILILAMSPAAASYDAPDRQPLGPQLTNPTVLGDFGGNGKLIKDGRSLKMVGNYWNVEGWVLQNGDLYLVWTRKDAALPDWIGVFKLKADKLDGYIWAWPKGRPDENEKIRLEVTK